MNNKTPTSNNRNSSLPTLAVAMIVKNEANFLERCLESIKTLADEIVILDSGSTDETEAIARRYTDKFYVNQEWPGFGPQRQLAQSYVESDWILWLDADEVVTPELALSIRAVLEKSDTTSIYRLDRLNWVFDRFVRYGSASPDFVARFYHTTYTTYNDNLVHESIIIPDDAKVVKLKGHLLHYSYTSYPDYLQKSYKYVESWVDQRILAGKKSSLSKAFFKTIGRGFRDYIFRRGFLDGRTGLLMAALSMQYTFNRYAMLHFKSKEQKNHENPPN